MTKTKITNDVLSQRVRKIEKYMSAHTGDVKARSLSTAFTPTTTGGSYYLTNVVQDDTAEGRTGDVINAHHFTLGTLFQMTATCSVRIVVVMDKMNQGSIPGITDILDSADVISPLNYLNTVAQKRFVILDDYTEHFTVGGILSSTKRKRIPLKSKMRWNGPLGAAANALANNIYAVAVTNVASAGQVNFYTRLEFTDE